MSTPPLRFRCLRMQHQVLAQGDSIFLIFQRQNHLDDA